MNFFDDLNKLNKDNSNDEFSDLNSKVYDEHDYILSPEKNPEFFEGLCKTYQFEKIPYNKNGFTQEFLNKIKFIYRIYCNIFTKVTSLNELKYFNNLEGIDSFCFSGCLNLKSIIFSENLKNIGTNSFYNCISLEKLYLPKNLKMVDDSAFEGCINLKEIIIPELFSERLKNIFYGVDLTKVNITYI